MLIIKRLYITRQLKRRFYEWDLATLRKHQAVRVLKILSYAQAHSKYYNHRLSSPFDLRSVPLMDKAKMMTHFNEINTAGLHGDDLVQFKIHQEREGKIDLYRNEFSIGLSSGTSGSRGLVVLSKLERQLYGCLLWARSGIPEEIKGYRVLFALRTNNPSFMEPKSFGVKLVYVDYTHPPKELVELINRKNINIIAGPPSLLSLIARHCGSITHKIDALISYAEVLDDMTRAYLEQTFNAPLAQIYQGAEGFIGSTCRRGNLHLNEDAVLIETEDIGDPAGKAKKIIVTDLYRTTQPMIRYSLGDILELDPELCECGSCFRVIRQIYGRADDIFLLKGIAGETRFLFPDYIVRSINQASDAILEFQAIQHSMDSIEIRLDLRPDADRSTIENAIRENLEWRTKKTGGQLGKVTFNDKLPERNSQSQKLIRVVRKF